MSDILADYREWRTQQAIRVSTHSDGCHMWHKDCMIHRLADALAKRTPSEAEIDALEFVAEEGRIASREDRGILRSWLRRLRHAWESTPGEPSTPGEGTRQAGLTLTDAEREAINMARSIMLVEHDLSVGAEIGGKQPRRSSGYWWTMADSLRGLLERTRNGSPSGCETGQ